MTKKGTTAAPEKVACTICRKEVPISEAIVPEAADYVAHFCGVKCYDTWRRQPDDTFSQQDIPTFLMPL